MATQATYELPPDDAFDNHPMDSEHLETVPLASALGAEVKGVNLAQCSDAQFEAVEAALHHHRVIFLRGQHLSFDEQEALTRRFGEFATDAFTPGMDSHPNIQRVVKEADERRPMVFGGTWHTDSAFLERPPAMSMLYAAEVPPYGGDTWWANTQLAYTFLSDTMKRMIEPLKVHMSARKIIRAVQRRTKGDQGEVVAALVDEFSLEEMMIRGQFHPLVRTHPITGKRGLYVDQTYAVGIEGLRKPEAAALLGYLVDHVVQPAFTCRLRWEKNMVVMWDNRATIHHAFNDYDGHRREMYRTIVVGERPI